MKTIEELLNEIGDDFMNLNLSYVGRNGYDRWHAVDRKLEYHCFGASPEEALQNLCNKLKEKNL